VCSCHILFLLIRLLLPFRYLSKIRKALETLLSATVDNHRKSLNEIRAFCPELADLLRQSLSGGVVNLIAGFVSYLVEFVADVHSTDSDAPDVQPIQNSYNPESGVAYYFTESGNILRSLPQYAMSDETESTCRKQYPQISFGGL